MRSWLVHKRGYLATATQNARDLRPPKVGIGVVFYSRASVDFDGTATFEHCHCAYEAVVTRVVLNTDTHFHNNIPGCIGIYQVYRHESTEILA